MRRKPKYDQTPQAPSVRELSKADQHKLAKLVEKYGIDTIVATAPIVQKRNRGRPRRGVFPFYEAIHFADWIEEQAEKHRKAGCKAPVRQARIDAFQMAHGISPSNSELATIKRKHLRGLKDLAALRRALESLTRRGN